MDEGILPPDPEPLEQGMPKPDVIEGLSMRMTQAMNHYQQEEHQCFVCRSPDHFAWDCPHWDSCMWWKEQLNTKGVGSQLKGVNKPSQEVNAWVATTWGMSSMIASRPTTHWVGLETLVHLSVEGREINALVDSGSQVIMVTPNYVHHDDFPMLPPGDLVNHPLNLVGLGGTWTHLLGFMVLRVRVEEIAGYNEDMVFLMVPDESDFAQQVPS